MISAEDKLMEGNLLYISGTTKVDRVERLSKGLINGWNREKYDPILISPDILEKCPDIVWKYGTTFFIGKLKFTYEKNELSEFVRFHYSGKVKYLQYLHELQNLVHILTNTELTITL